MVALELVDALVRWAPVQSGVDQDGLRPIDARGAFDLVVGRRPGLYPREPTATLRRTLQIASQIKFRTLDSGVGAMRSKWWGGLHDRVCGGEAPDSLMLISHDGGEQWVMRRDPQVRQ
jgi:hypothetical protein